MTLTHLGEDSIESPLGRVERKIGVVDGPDADVSSGVIQHLLIVKLTVWQIPLHRPKPLDEANEFWAGLVPSKVDMAHHRCGVDDAAGVT